MDDDFLVLDLEHDLTGSGLWVLIVSHRNISYAGMLGNNNPII
jgi:hypothetical protein